MTYDTINGAQTVAGSGEGTLLANRYRVVRQLGQGGMGSVWLAEDTQLDNKPFAIKMLPSILVANKRAYRQLKDEALVAMKLTHPNIVTLRAFEENNGNPFLVMDYIDGQTLDDYLAEKGTLSEDEVIRVLRPIAAALDYAHSEGVVHRDVKPANVIICKDGHPYILDFGIAREIQETLTRVTGKLSSGTLLYMSPEQLTGAPPQPPQDVYSFAAMAYECLKGEPPFTNGNIEYQIMNLLPQPISGGACSCAAAVMAGLAKESDDRPKSCMDVLEGRVPFTALGKTTEENLHKKRTEHIERIVVGKQSFFDQRLITKGTPLMHLDIGGHKVQKKSKAGLRFLSSLLLFLSVVVGVVGVGVWSRWKKSLKGGLRYYEAKELLDKSQGATEVSGDLLVSMGYNFINTDNGRVYISPTSALKLRTNDSGNVSALDIRSRMNVAFVRKIRYVCMAAGLSLLLALMLIFLRKFAQKRTVKALHFFQAGKWTEAMDIRYMLFANDNYVLYYHAICYLFGFGGMTVNYAQSEKLFLQSARRGVGEALVGLGWMAENGLGMSRSHERAVQYYAEARTMGIHLVQEN